MQPISIPPILLPTLTSALGLAGLSSGVYTFISPFDAVRPFGLVPPPTSHTKNSTSNSPSQPFHHALIKAYGIRNIGSGLYTLLLTYFWKSQVPGSVAEKDSHEGIDEFVNFLQVRVAYL